MSMDQWGWFGVFVLLIIVAGGIGQVVSALAGIAGDLAKIRAEIQGLRGDLNRERHPREERDPFS